MSAFKIILIFITIISVSESANFLEKLFRNHINDARCFTRCRSVVSQQENEKCLNLCKMFIRKPDADVCSLASVCSGECRNACVENDENQTQKPSAFASVSLKNCQLSWTMETPNRNVVFLVSGKDQAGKWNLIRNLVEDKMLMLNSLTVAKMDEIQVFAVEPQKVTDIVSLDVSKNVCLEPENLNNQGGYRLGEEIQNNIVSEEWKEENDEDSINMELISKGTSITAIILLSLLGVFATVFTSAIIYAKTNQPKQPNTNESGLEDDKYETMPELPYSVPSIQPSIDDLLFTSPAIKISDGQVKVEKLLKPRILSIAEIDEYEEVEITKTRNS